MLISLPVGRDREVPRENVDMGTAVEHPRPERLDAEALWRQWEPLAWREARRHGNAAEREDLEQVARLGLGQAVRRFDPARGAQFSTFAVPTIRGAILNYLRDQAQTLRVSRGT